MYQVFNTGTLPLIPQSYGRTLRMPFTTTGRENNANDKQAMSFDTKRHVST